RDSVVGTGSASEPFRLRSGGTSCFLPENPCLHVLPVRVVLRCKLPPSLVGVGEAPRLRRQRHSQKQAQLRVAGNHQFRDDLEVAARLLLGPKAHSGRQQLQAKGSAAVTAYLMANVAAGVVRRPLFQEDRLDAGLEKLIIKRRPRRRSRLRGGRLGGLLPREGSRRIECDRRRYYKTGKHSLRTDIRNHNLLQ